VRLLAEALRLEGPARAALEAARDRSGGRHRDGGVSPNAGDRGGLRRPAAVPLVGRARELALLERHLNGEGPPVLLLAGEPGIGKSRLLHEAAARAGGHGWQVLAGGCQRGHAPFAPLLEALHGYLAGRPRSAWRGDLRGCAWLVRLLPELAGGPIEPLPAWTLPPEQERRLMFAAAGRFAANVAGPAGTLFLLDDLQWAGADALDLLAALLAAPATPLRVIGAYRDTDVTPRDALARCVADLAMRGLATPCPLAPLAAEEVGQLIDVLLDGGGADPAGLREHVIRRTGGVPFFVVSCAQALRLGPVAGSGAAVPWDAEQSIRQRVAALPEAAREVLGVAALVGRAVDPLLLIAVVDQGERAVLDALDAAASARLLVGQERAYQFAHDLIREVVEADVGPARRLVLHRRIAEALERDGAVWPAEVLAYHYGRADVTEKALLHLERAGDHAWAQHANAAAEGHYREVADGLERHGRPLDAARVREKLALVLYVSRGHERTLAVLEQATEAYQAAEDLESLARVTAQIGLVHQGTGRFEEAVARLQPLAQRLEAQGPSPGLVRLYAALSDLQTCGCGRYRDGLITAERAVSLARTLGDTQLLAEALAAEGAAHLSLGQLGDAERALQEAAPLAAAAGDLVESLPKALWLLSLVHLRYGQLAQSRHYCEREHAVTARTGHAIRREAATALHGLIAYVSGDWAQARRDGEQALELDLQIGTTWISALPPMVVGLISCGEGRREEASRYLEASVALEGERVGHHPYVDYAPVVLAECAVREGHPERARARLAPLERAAGDASLVLPAFAWAHLEVGDVAAAATLVGRSITSARARNDRLTLVDALRVQALVALHQQRWAEAEQVLEEGLALAHSMPYPYAEARLLHIHGTLHARRSEPGPARERLEAALTIFRRLGAREDGERVQQALGTLPGLPARGVGALDAPSLPARPRTVARGRDGGRRSRQDRQAWALERLHTAGPLSPRAYAAAMAVSADTALLDLRDLVDRGLVRAEGRTKNRRYVLSANEGPDRDSP
jgi:tetratricopeptide (TPR) repeat protein